jgi:hypothetical protein
MPNIPTKSLPSLNNVINNVIRVAKLALKAPVSIKARETVITNVGMCHGESMIGKYRSSYWDMAYS